MIDEKLADKVGPTIQEEMLVTLKNIETHLKALVFYSTPDQAFISSAGKAPVINQPTADLDETIKEEITKYLKENK